MKAESTKELSGEGTLLPDRGIEHRVAKRHACDGFAEVVVPESGTLFRGEIADLSESGCYVKTRAHLRIRRLAEVELRFTVGNDRFSVTARTASLNSGEGAGFQFLNLAPSTATKLQRLIDALSAAESSR